MINFTFAGRDYQTGRIIGDVGSGNGPTLTIIGGIHGNEPTGVIAIQQVVDEIVKRQIKLSGRFIGLVGNMAALAANKRFIVSDLNRIWNQKFLYNPRVIPRSIAGHAESEALTHPVIAATTIENPRHEDPSIEIAPIERMQHEAQEQQELFEIVEPLLAKANQDRNSNSQNRDELYFIDLHTTSAPSAPFIAINDQLNNRKFALHFPIPKVLGIEEFLEGPLLSYLNDLGHVALAFEGGQHRDLESIQMHKAFIYQALVVAGVVSHEQIPDLERYQNRLADAGRLNDGFFEVVYRKPILADDNFVMNPGYTNFLGIKKGETLAQDRSGMVTAIRKGRIFMPLYQPEGADGFFIVKKIPRWALRFSSVLRKFNFERLLVLLPGVSRCKDQPDALRVNKRVARWLATDLFHLLGYRRKKDNGDVMIFSRREIKND